MTADRFLSVIDSLARHWSRRRIGNTTAMRLGSDATNCFVLSNSMSMARDVAGYTRGIVVDQLPEKLAGLRAPLVADHYVLAQLFDEAARRIRDLQAQHDRQAQHILQLQARIDRAMIDLKDWA